MATAIVKKAKNINNCTPPHNNEKDVIVPKNRYRSSGRGVTLYGNGGEITHREAVWMDNAARRSAQQRLPRQAMREGFSLSSALGGKKKRREVAWMDNAARRSAQQRPTRQAMREGFSLSSALGEAVAVSYSSSAGSRSMYLGKDVMGSVRSATVDTGMIAERYEYDAFGQPYSGDLSGAMCLGYTGKPYDAGTGLYNYGYRDYQPQAARFTTVDPIRDGNNWYAYVNNDPVNWIDPWGLAANDNRIKNNPTPNNPNTPGNTTSPSSPPGSTPNNTYGEGGGISWNSGGVVTVGLSGTATFGIGLSGSVGFTFEKNENGLTSGVYATGSLNFGTPYLGSGVTVSYTPNATAKDLNGLSSSSGGSIPFVGVNADMNDRSWFDPKSAFSVTIGPSTPNFEYHFSINGTVTGTLTPTKKGSFLQDGFSHH